ncbi:alpha-glucan family phosphorylase, partial [Planctomycetota bacterium]
RRAAGYKRADLLFHDLERLKNISKDVGAIQIVYAGKAHPQDQGGKELIQRIIRAQQQLKPEVKVVYISNYDMDLARLITAGVDVWLNTPMPPMEASGTSGMKAALNGVPSLSILDGWWLEGCIENLTGWAIDEDRLKGDQERNDDRDAQSLYHKLQEVVIPKFYNQRERFVNIMLHAIALNGSFFNTQRMIQQYVLKAYFS